MLLALFERGKEFPVPMSFPGRAPVSLIVPGVWARAGSAIAKTKIVAPI